MVYYLCVWVFMCGCVCLQSISVVIIVSVSLGGLVFAVILVIVYSCKRNKQKGSFFLTHTHRLQWKLLRGGRLIMARIVRIVNRIDQTHGFDMFDTLPFQTLHTNTHTEQTTSNQLLWSASSPSSVTLQMCDVCFVYHWSCLLNTQDEHRCRE